MPYFDDCKTYRERAGLNMAELARAATVDRGTVSRIESHKNVTMPKLMKIVNALNDLYYAGNGAPVMPERVITETSRFGGRGEEA